MFFLPLLILIFLLPASAAIPDFKTLSKDAKWHRLLHYKKRYVSGHKSEVDSTEFFLSSEGKYNPEAELIKTYELFSSTEKPDNGHPICHFPLRFKWLNQKLGSPWKTDLSGCTTYISFFQKMAAKRASIIFSSYYLSNPNSAFGHTLLRLSRFEDSSETELLDYGINFAAEARAVNPLVYMVKGLLGGYPGRFNAVPYYYKIREYTNGEFRDLWSYELNLTTPQVFELVDHVWELGRATFDYYYFDENCSYHLMALLEVVFPEKDLTSRFRFFAIPADTIRKLRLEGLIAEGKKRESTYTRLIRLSADLPAENLILSKDLALKPEKVSAIKKISDQEAADVLDVSLEAFDYFNSQKILSEDPATKKNKEPLLAARAANPIITEEKKVENVATDSPANTHSPVRLSLYQGYEHLAGQLTRFEFRTSFHDMLDPVSGSLRDGELEMGRISIEHVQRNYEDDGKFRFDHFSVFSIKNFSEQNFWASPLSWELSAGAKRVLFTCFNCTGAFVDGSVGNTVQLQNGKYLLSFLMNGEVNVQSSFQENYRIGTGPKIYLRAKFTDALISGLSLPYHWYTYSVRDVGSNQAFLPEWETRYHMHNNLSLSLRTRGQVVRDYWTVRGELGLQYFY